MSRFYTNFINFTYLNTKTQADETNFYKVFSANVNHLSKFYKNCKLFALLLYTNFYALLKENFSHKCFFYFIDKVIFRINGLNYNLKCNLDFSKRHVIASENFIKKYKNMLKIKQKFANFKENNIIFIKQNKYKVHQIYQKIKTKSKFVYIDNNRNFYDINKCFD